MLGERRFLNSVRILQIAPLKPCYLYCFCTHNMSQCSWKALNSLHILVYKSLNGVLIGSYVVL